MMMIAMTLTTPAFGQVVLRSGETLDAPISEVSAAGVAVRGDAPGVLTWDRIGAVRGEHADEAAPFLPMAEALWRARTRLARGDVRLARPIFEEWFSRDDGPTGATALLVAEGLLRCRLAGFAQTSAIEPWLRALSLRDEGARADLGFESAIDDSTGLAPGLPPIWLPGAAVSAFAGTPPLRTGDQLADALAALYHEAAVIETVDPAASTPPAQPVEPGAQSLVRAIIEARSEDHAVRARARVRLRSGLARDQGSWREAWRRAALGRSLLMEDDPDARDLGLVQLLHLPARFRSAQPYLTGVALALAAAELEAQGDAAGAARLTEELAALDPAHPGFAWLQRARAGAPNATAPPRRTDKEAS